VTASWPQSPLCRVRTPALVVDLRTRARPAAIVHVCSCGLAYTAETWAELPGGYVSPDYAGGWFESRNCSCHSTRSVEWCPRSVLGHLALLAWRLVAWCQPVADRVALAWVRHEQRKQIARH
jgi:hypothetical protein